MLRIREVYLINLNLYNVITWYWRWLEIDLVNFASKELIIAIFLYYLGFSINFYLVLVHAQCLTKFIYLLKLFE